MQWEIEPWRKLYVRDTLNWKSLNWQARAVALQLVKYVDEAGLLHVGKNPARGLSRLIDFPIEVTAPALDPLIDGSLTAPSEDDGTLMVLVRDGVLVLRNFVEAQTARTAGKVLRQMSRKRARANATETFDALSDVVRRGPTASADVRSGLEEKEEIPYPGCPG